MDIKVNNKLIGENHPVFIIAELSANHNQNYEVAVKTIKAAKEAGADAIKLQTYTADTLTIDCDNDYFKIKGGTLWDDKNLYQLYEGAYTPWEWHSELKKIAEDLGLVFFSTPFDNSAVDFLEELNVPLFKVASFEIKDLPLVEYIASKGKPVIISTGIATLEDINEAVETCKKAGNNKIILLKCTSAYPTPLEDANLSVIPDLKKRFEVVSGLSDHTLGISAPIAAVALGAKVIEKHLILDKKLGGPDVEFSLEPHEFKEMVERVREVEKAVGKVTYELSEKVKTNKQFARSLFVVEDIKSGELFTSENVRSIRPGYGMEPKYIKEIIGKKAKIEIKRGTPLSFEMIS